MPDVLMPRLSDSMEEGTILQWLKQVGEPVALGEELVEIETDKANMAYEADVAGTLTEILAGEGETLPIGSVIARIGGPSAEGRESSSAGPVAPATPTVRGASGSSAPRGAPAATPPAQETSGPRVKASPLARRLARDRGLDLSSLQGSGPGGRIVKADVEGAAQGARSADSPTPTQQVGVGESAVKAPLAAPSSPETAKGTVTYEEPNKTQQVIARRMAESKATAPHFYLTAEIEMSRAVEARKAIKAQAKEGEVIPSFNDM
ncbi:MAG TPA: biotin/lipoyl-containing protein, partial [Solirubrobacterales bacterium]